MTFDQWWAVWYQGQAHGRKAHYREAFEAGQRSALQTVREELAAMKLELVVKPPCPPTTS